MTKEEVIERFTVMLAFNEMLPSVEIEALETAISMLTNATIWTPCSERMPTKEDGGKFGKVNTLYDDGSIDDCVPDEIDLNITTHWSRIEPIGGGNG